MFKSIGTDPTFLGGWMSGIDDFSMSSGLFRFPRARTCRGKPGWVFLVHRGPLSSHLSRDWSLESGGSRGPGSTVYERIMDDGRWKTEDGRRKTEEDEFSCREKHAIPKNGRTLKNGKWHPRPRPTAPVPENRCRARSPLAK